MKRNALIILAASLIVALPAAARHPGYDDMEEVKRLAHEVDRAARHLHRSAEAEAHHFDRRESYALEHLHFLEDAARHFHAEVERYYRDPRHTERDFHRLYAAYRDAVDTFGFLHAYDHLYRDLRRVERPMERLAAYYGVGPRYGDYRGHGRYDRYPTRGHRTPRWHFSIGWRK